MIDNADIAMLGIVAIILLASILVTKIAIRRDGWKLQKYKLYAVRDNLIYLVATNKLKEDDFVFQRFYKAVNYFIDANDKINLHHFVSAAEKARRKGIDPAEEKNFREIHSALKTMGPEVNEVANQFYSAMLEILIENSFLLRVVMKCSSLSAVVKILANSIAPRHTNRAALQFYDDYSRAAAA